MEKPTIRYNDYDFLPWTTEKHGSLLMYLCELVRENPDVSLQPEFHGALTEAVKLYLFLNGYLNAVEIEKICALLIKYNTDGIAFLQDLFHSAHDSEIGKGIFRNEPYMDILSLIKENERTNRTLIAERLVNMPCKNAWAKRIADDLEAVHEGTQTWEWFYNLHCNDDKQYELVYEDQLTKDIYQHFQSLHQE